MTRRALAQENIRKISRIGDQSLGLTLPKEILKSLNWRDPAPVSLFVK